MSNAVVRQIVTIELNGDGTFVAGNVERIRRVETGTSSVEAAERDVISSLADVLDEAVMLGQIDALQEKLKALRP